MSQTDMYAPCPCGSGKKYKFCCHQKPQSGASSLASARFWAGNSANAEAEYDVLVARDGESFLEAVDLNRDAMRQMQRSEFEKAIPIFRKAVALSKDYYSPANNLAVCLYVVGKLDEAVRVQRKSLEDSEFENPFGLANLATLLYFEGEETEARDCLEQARTLEPPSGDACVKVCEVLARFRRHRDLLDYVDASRYAGEMGVCFYSGVAAANLGDIDRAERDLRKVNIGYHKADKARDYLDLLRRGGRPNTVRGDWPYLVTYELCPSAIIDQMTSKKNSQIWLKRPIAVDVCELMMNDRPNDSKASVELLCMASHPASVDLLTVIVNGRFGPDAIRIHAVQELQKRGVLNADEPVALIVDGDVREVKLTGCHLNSDYQFVDPLPPEWEEVYFASVEEARAPDPDWAFVESSCRRVMEAFPEHHSARFNYCAALRSQNREDEAEPILWDLVKRAPDYLFARAALVQLLVDQDRLKEAGKLIDTTPEVKETHPAAMVVWLLAQSEYHDVSGDEDIADEMLLQALEIDPDNPRANQLCEDYGLPAPRKRGKRKR